VSITCGPAQPWLLDVLLMGRLFADKALFCRHQQAVNRVLLNKVRPFPESEIMRIEAEFAPKAQ
jgi:hypothetical protein